VRRKGKEYLPFCITTNQWIQVNRPLLTRTANQKEYEESFHVLVTIPYLRTMIPTYPLEKAYSEVLNRLARYENMTPKLALDITTDRHFMVTVTEETNEQKKEEKIKSKIIDVASQLQKENETLGESVKQKDTKIEGLERRIGTIEKKIEEKDTENQKQIEELQNDVEEEKAKREGAEKEVAQVTGRLKAIKTNLTKWSIFAGGLILTSLILWLKLYKLLPLETSKNQKMIIGILSQLVLLFAFLNIPLKRYWKLWLSLIVSLIIAILIIFGT